MFWSDIVAKKIVEEGKYAPYWVDDMFTPSGFAHIGSLRGPLVHDIVYRALKDAKNKPKFTYIFNDFDPIDGLPPELYETSKEYLGFPLRTAPSPVPGFNSFAHYFSQDFKEVLQSLGFGATFLSSWDMYQEGKFNDVIKTALDNAQKIQTIYQQVSGSKKSQSGWLPLQVICQNCKKLGTTKVTKWDGKTVTYTCEPEMVKWAKGCGHEGEVTPFDGTAKLPWKVDWPAHWKVLGVTIEGAGKDHSSAGGSRDIAKVLCKEVFHIQEPYNLPYEFFLIGGKKMSSSKGLGLKGRDLTKILPPSVGRFLFTRTDYRQAIEFDPMSTMAIPDLFDEYDRCWQSYNTDGDTNFARAFELAQISNIPPKNPTLFLPRFRDVANYIQLPNIVLVDKFTEVKGNDLTDEEKQILSEREKYARIWNKDYAPLEFRVEMTKDIPSEVSTLSSEQKEYLSEVISILQTTTIPEELQVSLYEKAKQMKLDIKLAFKAIYLSISGKTSGPKAAWFLLQYPKDAIITRLSGIVKGQGGSKYEKTELSTISRPDFFIIDNKVKEMYPSVSVGIAYIKGVTIRKIDEQLELEKVKTIEKIKQLDNEKIGMFPEVQSYRTLYKKMGIDWHSRRPSPEALLRRIVQGKGLYTVNTCVDAYNLTVLHHKVSVGVFDADHIGFPTKLQFANKGDEILLLGDELPTVYTQKELAYYDTNGGYNIDFNYRDAKRTMVTEKTTNLWINVDGIYDISPSKVEEVLQDAVERIKKYCGGSVEFQGVVV